MVAEPVDDLVVVPPGTTHHHQVQLRVGAGQLLERVEQDRVVLAGLDGADDEHVASVGESVGELLRPGGPGSDEVRAERDHLDRSSGRRSALRHRPGGVP